MTPHERIWKAILKLAKAGAAFSAGDVQDACEPMVLFGTVEKYMRDLRLADYLNYAKAPAVQKQHGNRHAPTTFTLINAVPQAPRVTRGGAPALQGMGNLAMWTAMRVLKRFDSREIARAASLEALVVSETTARKYVDALYYAGYLQQLRAPTRQLAAQYRLKRNTGPYAPAITRRRAVFDRNTGEFAELETAQEVCDAIE